MRQALHIFRKDVRHLRWEIALLLALIVLAAYEAAVRRGSQAQGWAEVLLGAMILLLPVRLVHAEALPGERQF